MLHRMQVNEAAPGLLLVFLGQLQMGAVEAVDLRLLAIKLVGVVVLAAEEVADLHRAQGAVEIKVVQGVPDQQAFLAAAVVVPAV